MLNIYVRYKSNKQALIKNLYIFFVTIIYRNLTPSNYFYQFQSFTIYPNREPRYSFTSHTKIIQKPSGPLLPTCTTILVSHLARPFPVSLTWRSRVQVKRQQSEPHTVHRLAKDIQKRTPSFLTSVEPHKNELSLLEKPTTKVGVCAFFGI